MYFFTGICFCFCFVFQLKCRYRHFIQGICRLLSLVCTSKISLSIWLSLFLSFPFFFFPQDPIFFFPINLLKLFQHHETYIMFWWEEMLSLNCLVHFNTKCISVLQSDTWGESEVLSTQTLKLQMWFEQ